jgi:branched-chain amino acid transport system substrate-binding protein
MNRSSTGKWTAALVLLGGAGLGFGPGAWAADTVNVGLSTTMSGAIGPLGQSNKNGIELAIAKINAEGGLLGKQIKLLSAEDTAKPATGVTNARNFVLSDKVKALFGPVSSAVGSAEAGVAAQYKVPIFYSVSNDVDQTGRSFSKYVFQVVPSTYMEPHAVASYIARQGKAKGWKTYYTVSPDYSFGRTTVDEFLKGMKANGASVDLVGQQWPGLGSSDFSQYISAIVSKKPDFLFVGQYGGDLVTFTKQAEGAGLFKAASVYAGYWMGALQALGASAPAGVISSDRAAPFYLSPSADMKSFTQAYHTKFGGWPPSWAILGYSAVETWAQGVKKAGSFDADKVAAALSGATIDSALRGSFKIRECDHQAEVPEYMGVLSQDVSAEYGIRTMTNVEKVPGSKIMMSCEAKQALQKS